MEKPRAQSSFLRTHHFFNSTAQSETTLRHSILCGSLFQKFLTTDGPCSPYWSKSGTSAILHRMKRFLYDGDRIPPIWADWRLFNPERWTLNAEPLYLDWIILTLRSWDGYYLNWTILYSTCTGLLRFRDLQNLIFNRQSSIKTGGHHAEK